MPFDRSVWRKLGEALLNATLMLIAVILLLTLVLVVQLRGLTGDLRADLAGMQARNAAIQTQAQAALTALDQAREQRGQSLPDEVARARDGLEAVLQRRADAAPDPGAQAGPLPRRMLLAAVTAAMQTYQAAQPGAPPLAD